MTERNLIIQSRRDTRAALLLLAAFAVCLSAPELTDIRRPFHDAVGLFYGRIFMTDAVRNGSIPFWYPYTRYSIPYYSLEGGMGWSPIGFLVGAIAPYNLFSWAVEGLLWNLLCLGGTFAFARRHVSSPFTAAAIAMTYSASGLMVGSVPTIGTTRAFQIGPWAFVAIDTLVRATSPSLVSWLRGTTIFAVTGMLWITSGYPGIWLTAPVLGAPYALMASRGRAGTLFATGTAATIGGLLSLGMCSLLIDGTLNAPFFGEPGARPAFSPADGALEFRSLIHTFLANPGYLRNLSDGHEPLYMGSGVFIGLFLVWRLTNSFFLNFALFLSTILFSLHTLIVGNIDGWPLILFGLACLASIPDTLRMHTYTDVIFVVQAIFSLVLASRNVIGDFFRAFIPPFTMIRWNNWYLWISILCITVYSWRNIEAKLYSIPWGTPIATRHSVFNMVSKINFYTLISAVVSLCYGIYLLRSITNTDYNYIHKLSYYYIDYLAIIYFTFCLIFIIISKKRFLLSPFLLFFLFILIPLVIGLTTDFLFSIENQSHRIGIEISTNFFLLWDIIQIVVISVTSVILVAYFRHKMTISSALALVATGVALDMSLASPRILSHTYYLRAGQIDRPTLIDRSFSFTGNERQANESTMSTGSSLYNAFKKSPDQLKTPGTQPQMEMYDVGAGSPSPFGQFVWFPKQWSSALPNGRESQDLDSLAELPGQPWPPAGASTISSPTCDDARPSEPSGRISKLLPDRVIATIQADCARLVVLMDTWAPGWSVSVDGQPTLPIRVNGVLRGVEVPAGDHTIMWFYRPVHWTLIVSVTVSSLLITIALGVASVALPGRLKVLAS